MINWNINVVLYSKRTFQNVIVSHPYLKSLQFNKRQASKLIEKQAKDMKSQIKEK